LPLKEIKNLRNLIASVHGLKGLNVTIPLKELVLDEMDEVDEVAEMIGAVNCISISGDIENLRLKGFNTDIYGFEMSLLPHLENHHKKALILGTGGSSKAVAFVLGKLNIEYIIVSRAPIEKGQIGYDMVDKAILLEHSLVINTTPVGMFPDIRKYPPIPFEYLTSRHLLFDLIYNPEETLFLKKGKSIGAKTVNGLEMLKLQAEKSWEIWNKIQT
jgi:shikimate dehydrogenase